MKNLKKFFKDESGATAIEYGLLAALISIVAIAVMTTSGDALKAIWTTISTELTTAST